MRFSSILLALPLLGSVLGVPIETAKRCDVCSTLSGLKNTLGSIASLSPATIEGDLQNVLTEVDNALDAAAAQLGINIGTVTGEPGYLSGAFNPTQFLYAIAADLEAIVQDVETIISDTTVSGSGSVSDGNLQQEIQNALNSIVLGLAIAVNGLSPLIANLLVNLGLSVDGTPIVGASGSGSGLGVTGL